MSFVENPVSTLLPFEIECRLEVPDYLNSLDVAWNFSGPPTPDTTIIPTNKKTVIYIKNSNKTVDHITERITAKITLPEGKVIAHSFDLNFERKLNQAAYGIDFDSKGLIVYSNYYNPDAPSGFESTDGNPCIVNNITQYLVITNTDNNTTVIDIPLPTKKKTERFTLPTNYDPTKYTCYVVSRHPITGQEFSRFIIDSRITPYIANSVITPTYNNNEKLTKLDVSLTVSKGIDLSKPIYAHIIYGERDAIISGVPVTIDPATLTATLSFDLSDKKLMSKSTGLSADTITMLEKALPYASGRIVLSYKKDPNDWSICEKYFRLKSGKFSCVALTATKNYVPSNYEYSGDLSYIFPAIFGWSSKNYTTLQNLKAYEYWLYKQNFPRWVNRNSDEYTFYRQAESFDGTIKHFIRYSGNYGELLPFEATGKLPFLVAIRDKYVGNPTTLEGHLVSFVDTLPKTIQIKLYAEDNLTNVLETFTATNVTKQIYDSILVDEFVGTWYKPFDPTSCYYLTDSLIDFSKYPNGKKLVLVCDVSTIAASHLLSNSQVIQTEPDIRCYITVDNSLIQRNKIPSVYPVRFESDTKEKKYFDNTNIKNFNAYIPYTTAGDNSMLVRNIYDKFEIVAWPWEKFILAADHLNNESTYSWNTASAGVFISPGETKNSIIVTPVSHGIKEISLNITDKLGNITKKNVCFSCGGIGSNTHIAPDQQMFGTNVVNIAGVLDNTSARSIVADSSMSNFYCDYSDTPSGFTNGTRYKTYEAILSLDYTEPDFSFPGLRYRISLTGGSSDTVLYAKIKSYDDIIVGKGSTINIVTDSVDFDSSTKTIDPVLVTVEELGNAVVNYNIKIEPSLYFRFDTLDGFVWSAVPGKDYSIRMLPYDNSTVVTSKWEFETVSGNAEIDGTPITSFVIPPNYTVTNGLRFRVKGAGKLQITCVAKHPNIPEPTRVSAIVDVT